MGIHQTETARERLARLMDERREELGLNWNQVAERAGLTKTGLNHVRFENRKMRAPTKRGLEEALSWARGSIDRYLESDGDPATLEPVTTGTLAGSMPSFSGGATASVEVTASSDIDITYHAPDGGRYLIQVKAMEGTSERAEDLAKAIEDYANHEGGTVFVGREENPTIREILDDPNLPDEVKRPLVAAYELLRSAAAAALKQRPAEDGPPAQLRKISKG
ncbi:hypothetical protein [Microbispora sp. NPDC049633]|uniref:hypothetical protein n=1 Tax=Microbispora sp. NPDC049633 TaxID=3154355 RepID=UPI00341B79A5